jgi:hypothetical protein
LLGWNQRLLLVLPGTSFSSVDLRIAHRPDERLSRIELDYGISHG